MTRHRWLLAVAACVSAPVAHAQMFTSSVFTEDFESLAGSLGASVNEREGFPLVTRETTDPDSVPVAGAFSAVGPAGWTVDNTLGTFNGAPTVGNTGVPTGGVAEWEGWSFANKDFWIEADDQSRSEFDLGQGTVAVADPDEYYDLDLGPGDLGFYNSSLGTPSVGLAELGVASLGVQVSFDSSYRLENFDDSHPDPAFNDLNNSAGEVVAVFNTGEVQSSLIFDSTVGDDDTNSRKEVNFFPATAATSVEFFFNLGNAGNDWWWAIDNVEVADIDINTGLPTAPTFSEDFEGVALGDSVNERRSTVPSKVTAVNDDPDTTAAANAFTHTPPAGWTRDNSATPVETLGDENVGVFEWEGWSFASKEFWNFADQQDRELFDKGQGVVAVADGDEWDDLGDPTDFGELNTLIETPTLDLTGLEDGEDLAIQFDSSWRAEDSQTAIVTVDLLDGNGPQEVLRWESDSASAFFKDDDVNETVYLRVPTGGADSAVVGFRYIGTNDWWWAVDNITVGAIPEPTSAALASLVAVFAAAARRRS